MWLRRSILALSLVGGGLALSASPAAAQETTPTPTLVQVDGVSTDDANAVVLGLGLTCGAIVGRILFS